MPIIALILANLPTIIQAGEAGYKFIASVRTAAQQTGEWTPEHEAEFQAKLANEALDPAWQLDATAASAIAAVTAAALAAAAAVLNEPAPPIAELPASHRRADGTTVVIH